MWDFAAFRGFLKYAELRTICCCPDSLIAPPQLYLDHSHCLLAPGRADLHSLAALPSTRAIETHSLPALVRCYPCSFTFYVSDPSAPFPTRDVFYFAFPKGSVQFLRLTQPPLQL